MGSNLRLRGPLILRGASLSTSVSSQSGSIPGGLSVSLAMSAYSFMPDILGTNLFTFLDVRVKIDFLGSPDADAPVLALINPGAPAVPYQAEWRHIDP